MEDEKDDDSDQGEREKPHREAVQGCEASLKRGVSLQRTRDAQLSQGRGYAEMGEEANPCQKARQPDQGAASAQGPGQDRQGGTGSRSPEVKHPEGTRHHPASEFG